MLKNKTILIGITGSISIYKICELIRLFVKQEANVKVMMSDGASKFMTPLVFEALTRNEVLSATNESWATKLNHIDFTKDVDVLLLAPLTANSLNKIANGYADNIFLETILAYKGKKVFAPSANTNMIENNITKTNINKLKQNGFVEVSSCSKLLACGDTGNGALAEVEDIFYITAREILQEEKWKDKKVIVSGGGTIEKIDDIRYVSNFSSGKMALSLAKSLYLKGADVTLIITRDLEIPSVINTIKVQSTKQMKKAIEDELTNGGYLFMAAAVSDFIPTFSKGKIKKENLHTLELKLEKNIDILKSFENRDDIMKIGFKAEVDENVALENAKNMLVSKKLDYVCLNIISEDNKFGSDNNHIYFIKKNEVIDLGSESKDNLANKILDEI